METLYDLLGALPRDDAQGLRTAFRKAVKSAHPDLNPDDPGAGQKFREIVRAQEILLDGDQRAVYDHLLALAQIEAAEDAEHAAEHARAGKIHRLASWVMTLAGASAVSIGGLAVATLLWTSTEPAADTHMAAITDNLATIKVMTVTAPSLSVPAAQAAPAETAGSAPPLDIRPPAETQAYERMRGFDPTFADIKRPEKAGRAGKKKGPAAAENGSRAERPRRTAANDLSRQESAAPLNLRP